jgi:hypothetical protein
MNIIQATSAASAVIPPSSPTTSTGNTGSKAKPAITFLSKNPDALLVVAIGRVITSMTGNATYPSPVPTLAVVTTAYDAYVQAVNTLDRGQSAQIRRNEARAVVTQLVRDLALYVQHTCQGGLGLLVSSGFPVQKGRGARLGVLDAPLSLRLLPGRISGQMRAQCNAVGSARSYQWRSATTQAPTAWTLSDPTTSSRTVLANLTPATSYVVQVRAVGTQGASNWSEVATLIAM